MITLQNMVFANPQAYRVFPQIGNPYNTGITDTAIYTGYLQVTDGSGNTKSFSNTSTIDFTGFQGTIDIDQYTDTGSVKLGRWKIASSTVITNDITINITDIEEIPADETTVTPEYEVKYNTYDNGQLISSIVVTPDSYTLQANVEWISIDGENIVISANTDTEPRQGQVTIQVSYQNYTASANYSITQSGNTISIDIMNSMVLWYDLKKQGATNESMSTTPTLIDHSGNGHNATCHNFAWSGMSGIGGYTTDFTNWKLYQGVESTQNSLTTVGPFHETQNNWVAYTTGYLPAMQVEVKGLPEGDVITYRYVDGDLSIQKYNVSNGIWNLPESLVSETNPNVGFMWDTKLKAGVSITLIPLYPYALVSDGVDDYCLVEGLPLLNKDDGYTVIAKRKILSDIGCIASKRNSVEQNGAFVFEIKTDVSPKGRCDSFGGRNSDTPLISEDVSWQKKDYYNGTSILFGDKEDTDELRLLCLFNNYYYSAALYSFLLFNRDLSTDEIEWVKTNLIESER